MKKGIVVKSIITSANMGYWTENDFTSSAPALSFVITKTVKNPVEKNIPHPGINQFSKELPLLSSDQPIAQQKFAQRAEKFTKWIVKNQKKLR